MLEVLHSPSVTISHTGAQVIAAFGAVDAQTNQWANLLPSLFANVSAAEAPLTAKVSSLEALGFMCEEMDPDDVGKDVVDVILNTIVNGMRADREDEIRKAAVAAMCNSLHFTERNFEIEDERNTIMQVVCEATQCSDVAVRMKAFECIATVAELYYDKLQDYMDALFHLTSTAIKNDNEHVGQKAVEFWCTVCDTEAELMEILTENESLPEGQVFLNIAEHAAAELTPLLLETMCKQQEDADEDTWDMSMAAATCLGSLSKAIGDEIVDLVVPFVSGNVMSDDWRLKEASILAFGSIMEGPSEDKLTPIVASALPLLLECLRDDSMRVRDSATYTVGRVCEHNTGAIADELIPSLFEALVGTLDDGFAQVCMQGCTAIHHLGEACSNSSDEETNVLSPYLSHLLEKLLGVTTRDDWDEHNLRSTAYEAINMLVEASAVDMQETVAMLLTEGLNRLEHTFIMQTDMSERMGLQSKLSGLVGICVQKLPVEAIDEEVADRIMTLTMQVFTSPGAVAHEEAFMAVGHLADKLESNFVKYVPHFMPALMTGLTSVEEYEVCTCAVGVVGDLCRSTQTEMIPYCDDIVQSLLSLLMSQSLNRVVKPHVISVFADISLAIEGRFDRYAATVLGMLEQAGEVAISTDDDDIIEYINTLRESILEAYIGIVQVHNYHPIHFHKHDFSICI